MSTATNKRVTILGYYGAGNTGDEAILAGMIQALKEQGITDITVLTRNPLLTKLEHQVKVVYTGRRSNGLAEVYQTIKNSDLFILGGGGLLHDYTARVVPYWLSRVALAVIAKTPIYIYANGVGPIYRPFSKFLIRRFVNKVDYITVRDESSAVLLSELKVTRPPIEVTADPALLLTTDLTNTELNTIYQTNLKLNPTRLNIAVSLRPWEDDSYIDNVVITLASMMIRHNVDFTLIPFQYGLDESINKWTTQQLNVIINTTKDAVRYLEDTYTPEEMVAVLGQFDGIIGMRLHSLALGAITNRPLFALSYDDKVANFMDAVGLHEYNYSLQEVVFYQEKFAAVLNNWLTLLKNENTNELTRPQVRALQQRAERNAEIAGELLAKHNRNTNKGA
jgi:polysaccharide pyruvyl transferase CsaB